MPLLNNSAMQNHSIGGSNYGFSGKRIEDLGASEYTLVTIVTDVSGSVWGFKDEIEKCVKEVVKACKHSPRSDYLLIRFVTFNTSLNEIHGFKPLADCNLADYDGSIRPGGLTALFDASYNAIESENQYGESLTKQDYDVNGIVFVITDGGDNASTATATTVGQVLAKAVTGEHLESMVSVLIGVNVQAPSLSQLLQDFATKAGFSQYEEIANADEKTLAKLASFVSRSISSQSQSLGTGGPSQSLVF